MHDPDSPYAGQYDEEVVLTVSDWYHSQIAELMPAFISKGNPTGAEPVPDAALFNDTSEAKLRVQPGKTYLVRMVNIGAFAGQYIWFEGHNMTLVEVDGVYTRPATAEMIYISAAQRCSFLITAKNETGTNYAFVGSMDTVRNRHSTSSPHARPFSDANIEANGWGVPRHYSTRYQMTSTTT